MCVFYFVLFHLHYIPVNIVIKWMECIKNIEDNTIAGLIASKFIFLDVGHCFQYNARSHWSTR